MRDHYFLDRLDGGSYIEAEVTGLQMKIIREVNGLTQRQVAAMLGITQAYVAQMETGVKRISRRTAIAFAAVINQHKDRGSRQAQSA